MIDEADMTWEFGYLEDIDAILGKMKENLQMMVFSATIPQTLRPFLQKYMHTPKIIEIDEKLDVYKRQILNQEKKRRYQN